MIKELVERNKDLIFKIGLGMYTAIVIVTFLAFIITSVDYSDFIKLYLYVEIGFGVLLYIYSISNKNNLIQNIKDMKNFFNSGSSNIIIIIILIISLVLYIVGFLMINSDIWNPLVTEYNQLSSIDKNKMWGDFLYKLSGLVLTVVILKYLLGMRHFKHAIREIFKEIFTEHNFLNGLDKEYLLKISKNIHAANNDIEFLDKTKNNESVEKLIKYYKDNTIESKDKNFIVIESHFNTTLLANNIEIMQRKLQFRILEAGEFKYKYEFDAPDNNEKLDYEDYEDTMKNNRFSELSYSYLAKSSVTDDGFQICNTLSNIDDNEGKKETDEDFVKNPKWVQILFTKASTVPGEIIDIEFSISHPFNFTNRKEVDNYYDSTYGTPHAKRNITFQIERYGDKKPKFDNISPILYNDKDKKIDGKYEESIYYKMYNWEIFYSEEESRLIKTKLK